MSFLDRKLYFGSKKQGHIKKAFCTAGFCGHHDYPKRHIGCSRNGFEHAEFNKQESNRQHSILVKCFDCGEERIEYWDESYVKLAPIDPDSTLHKQDVIGECPDCKFRAGTFVIYGDRSQVRRCKKCKKLNFVIDPVASFYGGYGPLSGDEIEELNEIWAKYTRGLRY